MVHERTNKCIPARCHIEAIDTETRLTGNGTRSRYIQNNASWCRTTSMIRRNLAREQSLQQRTRRTLQRYHVAFVSSRISPPNVRTNVCMCACLVLHPPALPTPCSGCMHSSWAVTKVDVYGFAIGTTISFSTAEVLVAEANMSAPSALPQSWWKEKKNRVSIADGGSQVGLVHLQSRRSCQ